MNTAMWDVQDEDDDGGLPGQPGPTLVSLHFIRSSLRRKRRLFLAAMFAGLLGAVAFLLAVPTTYTASATLALSHDPGAESEGAMATDVSLAMTRAVAQRTIAKLGLDETPVAFLQSITAEPTTSSILTLSLVAPDAGEAERQLSTYTSEYLQFRAQQLTSQAELLAQGSNERIDKLQKQAQDITDRIDRLTARGQSNDSGVGELISQRAQYGLQISSLQDAVQDSALKTTAIVAASRVIDSAAVEPANPLKRPILVVATGLIGSTALGFGLLLFLAVVSDKLHSRVEVATALEVPVATSIGKITPWPSFMRWIPLLRARHARRMADLQRFARAVEVAVPANGQGQWLAVACVDNAKEVSLGVVVAAEEIQRSGRVVRLIDLTDDGVLEHAVQTLLGDEGSRLAISRPKVAPALARDASDIVTLGPETRDIPSLRDTDVFLTVADLNPAIGAFHLTSWTQRVVVAVTAGESSAERVRTAADLVHTAGLELWSGILIDTEKSDISSGRPLSSSIHSDQT